MKWVLVLVTVCVVSLLAVLPALAESMPCDQTDQTTVQSLADCVQHAADNGFITNRLLASSLLAKTSAAQIAVDRGDNATAVLTLQAFILQVTAQAGQQIEAAHAAHMIMHAKQVIAVVGA